MPVADTDIIVYGSANMPEDDTGTSGGAIDKTVTILTQNIGDIGGNDTLDVVSDAGGDTTQTVTVTGRLPSGVIDTEAYSLAGTTPQVGSTTFERVLKIVVSATYTGTINIQEASGNVTLVDMQGSGAAPGGTAVLESRILFYDSAAEASGGSDKELFEKVFVANTHASIALTSAAIELTVDGTASNILDFDLEGSVNDTNSTTNRLTSPAGGDMVGAPTWADTQVSVPGGSLGDRTTGTSDHIGVWLQLDLDAGESPEEVQFTLQTTGQSI